MNSLFMAASDGPHEWQQLLHAILEPLACVESPGPILDTPPPDTTVIVADATLPEWIRGDRHRKVILAPSPFAPPPDRWHGKGTACRVRVLAFSSTCHAWAQRRGLESALFQYFPEPEAAGHPAPPFGHILPMAAFGPATLQSMALGLCVCVGESTTAADYVVHGVNGFIGKAEPHPSPEEAQAIGGAARLSIVNGFDRWQLDLGRLRTFLAHPDGGSGRSRYAHDFNTISPRRRSLTSEPLVTVATVVRNAAAALRQTLPSIVGQSFDAMEIMVLDGRSTDGTVDVIRDFADSLDHWQSQPDEGTYDAMQRAAFLARGRWILFMNAGDRFVDPHALGRLVAGADDADLVAGHHIYIDRNGHERLHRCVDLAVTRARLLAGNLDSDWVQGSPCHQAFLTRSALLREHGFDRSFRIAADHEFLHRMLSLGASHRVVPTVVAEYTAGGLSARNEYLCLEEWRRLARTHSYDPRRADRNLDRLLVMAMKNMRRRGPFDFAAEPARSHPVTAMRLDLKYRLKGLLRRAADRTEES